MGQFSAPDKDGASTLALAYRNCIFLYECLYGTPAPSARSSNLSMKV